MGQMCKICFSDDTRYSRNLNQYFCKKCGSWLEKIYDEDYCLPCKKEIKELSINNKKRKKNRKNREFYDK